MTTSVEASVQEPLLPKLNDGTPDMPTLQSKLAAVLEKLNSSEFELSDMVKGYVYHGKHKAPIQELRTIALQIKCGRLFLEDLIGVLSDEDQLK
jgi:hypothetical protein